MTLHTDTWHKSVTMAVGLRLFKPRALICLFQLQEKHKRWKRDRITKLTRASLNQDVAESDLQETLNSIIP